METVTPVSGPPSLQGGSQTLQTPTDKRPSIVIIDNPSKPASKSVTVQVNSAIIVVSFLASTLIAVQPQLNAAIIANFQQNPELGVALVTVLSSMIALFNVLIRVFRTSQPIAH